VWLDADALIWDMKADLRDAYQEMGGASIGACQHPGPPAHLNVGVEYWRNTEVAREFAVAWLAEMDRPHDGWLEQGVFNKMVSAPEWAGTVVRISDKWNATAMAGTDVPTRSLRAITALPVTRP